MARDNVISFEQTADGARRRLADAKLTPVLQAIRRQLVETLPRLMQDLFEHLDDDLYQLADKSASDALQTRYFEAMRELRKQRQAIDRQFTEARLLAFDDFWAQRGPAERGTGNQDEQAELSLIAEEELEEDLAISSMVSKSENRFHRELFAMNMRFTAMLGGPDIEDADNPVGPRALAEGFAEALALWPGETAVKLLIYKLFDRYVMAYIGGLYDDINDVMVGADILPKIVQRVRRNPVAPSVQRARDPQHQETYYEPSAAPAAVAADGGGDELLSILGDLLAARRQSAGTGGLRWSLGAPSNTRLPEISTSDLVGALHSVQQNSLHAAPVDLGEVQALQVELVGSLGRELDLGPEDNPTKRLARADQDVLNIMEMLFDFILGDDNLPEAMKALLGRLQIPLLKVAVLDRAFFNNRQHPARLLLNNLARAGVAWSDDGDRSADSAYGQIESAVTRILTEFSDDPSVFEQVNEDFTAYLERERRSAEVAEERVGQVKRGQEQLELARQKVSQMIQGHIQACQPPECAIPEAVAHLLDEAWHDVLLLAYLREGEQSQAWESAAEVVQQLVWSVQPKHDQVERQKLLKSIPELLKRVREGLVNISFDQHRAAVLFKELQACHIAALRGDRVEDGESLLTSDEITGASPPEVIELTPVPERELIDDEHQRAAENLKVGQWLEWENEPGEWQRGKLSWRSEVTQNCIFVSRKGIKVGEMHLGDIAARLRAGTARRLQDVETPLMDRALHAMVDALRRTDQAPAPQPG